MRKLLVPVLIIMAMFFVGCSNTTPESTVSEFVEAGKKFDWDKMLKAINPEKTDGNRNIGQNINNPEDEFLKFHLDYLKENAAKITYKIEKTSIKGKKADMIVKFKYINSGPLVKATLGEMISKAFSMALSGIEPNDDEMEQLYFSIMKDQQQIIEDTFVEKEIGIELVKVNNKWYLNEFSDELLDVFTSDFFTVADEISEAWDSQDDDE